MDLLTFLLSLTTSLAFRCAQASQFHTSGFAHLARQDPYISDLRLFSEPGCFDKNLGVWTITQSDLDTCFDYPTDVKAVSVTNINIDCSCRC